MTRASKLLENVSLPAGVARTIPLSFEDASHLAPPGFFLKAHPEVQHEG